MKHYRSGAKEKALDFSAILSMPDTDAATASGGG
jgi:hypothetical protein